MYLSVYSRKTGKVYGIPENVLHLLECFQVGKVLLEWGDSAISTVKLINRQIDSVLSFHCSWIWSFFFLDLS